MNSAHISVAGLADWHDVMRQQGDLDLLSVIDAGQDVSPQSANALTLEKFVRLLEKLGSVNPGCGLAWTIGLAAKSMGSGSFGQMICGSKTLGMALSRLSEMYPLVQDATSLQLEIEEQWTWLHYKILDPDIWPRHHDALYSLGIFSTLLRNASHSVWEQVEITVEASQEMVASDLSKIVHAKTIYGGQSNSIRFPTSALNSRLELMAVANTSLYSDLIKELVRKRQSMPMSNRVRQLIYGEMLDGLPSQDEAANKLGVSSRTLRRKLNVENISYQEILDQCRVRAAIFEIRKDKTMSLSEIALKLGYSEHSNFSRAFTRWTGITPQDYRRSAITG